MLTERQRLILNAIIDDYISSAEPVGSRTISKRKDVGYSPATIRNEMSDLEEMGYLEQPHTSAGRIPSIKGYRYYVDHLVKRDFLSRQELETIKVFFSQKKEQLEEVIQQVSNILSTLTNYTAIVLGPEILNTTLMHLQIVPLNDETAVAIIVTNTGHVENRIVKIPPYLPISEIEKVVSILNTKCKGAPLLTLKSRMHDEIADEIRKYVTHYEDFIRMIETILDRADEGRQRVYLSGTTNMLNQPEFKNLEKFKGLMDLFEETSVLARLIASNTGGIQVRIGTENNVEAIQDCSLVSATYSVDGQPLGSIGIIGPTRMDYGKVINLLEHLSKDLAAALERWYK